MQPGPSVVMVVRLFAPWVGGMERQALRLASELRRRELADVRIATGRWFRGTAADEVVEGVPVRRHATFYGDRRGRRKIGALVYMVTLFAHLLRRRPTYSLIHVHGLSYHTAVCRLVSVLTGVPMIVKLANSGEASDIAKMRRGQHLPGTRFLLGFSLGGDTYIALNGAIRAELEDAGVPAARIVEIPNGVDLGGFDPGVFDPGSSLHRGSLRMLFVGRLHAQKDLETVLDAMTILGEEGTSGRPAVSLDILGDGPERARLAHRIREGPLRDAVTMHGEVADVAPFFERTDVLLLPSRSEGISNALLEAMAHGIPVIVSDIPGNTAVVRDGVDGWVFRTGDARHLATVITDVLDDPQTLSAMGCRAYERVATDFSLSVIADRYAELYERFISKGKP